MVSLFVLKNIKMQYFWLKRHSFPSHRHKQNINHLWNKSVRRLTHLSRIFSLYIHIKFAYTSLIIIFNHKSCLFLHRTIYKEHWLSDYHPFITCPSLLVFENAAHNKMNLQINVLSDWKNCDNLIKKSQFHYNDAKWSERDQGAWKWNKHLCDRVSTL